MTIPIITKYAYIIYIHGTKVMILIPIKVQMYVHIETNCFSWQINKNVHVPQIQNNKIWASLQQDLGIVLMGALILDIITLSEGNLPSTCTLCTLHFEDICPIILIVIWSLKPRDWWDPGFVKGISSELNDTVIDSVDNSQ